VQNKKMLKSTERLIAFAILYQTYSSQPTSANPYVALFINVSSAVGVFRCYGKDYYHKNVFICNADECYDLERKYKVYEFYCWDFTGCL